MKKILAIITLTAIACFASVGVPAPSTTFDPTQNSKTLVVSSTFLGEPVQVAEFVRTYVKKNGTVVNGYVRTSYNVSHQPIQVAQYGSYNSSNGQFRTNYVNGYYKSNGTYVNGYYRS